MEPLTLEKALANINNLITAAVQRGVFQGPHDVIVMQSSIDLVVNELNKKADAERPANQ